MPFNHANIIHNAFIVIIMTTISNTNSRKRSHNNNNNNGIFQSQIDAVLHDDINESICSSEDISLFRRGNIRRVSLMNFMTYTYTSTQFGANLNLIIGPNGSGKCFKEGTE